MQEDDWVEEVERSGVRPPPVPDPGPDSPTEPGGPPVLGRRRAFSGGLWSAASAVLPMAGTLALSIVIGRRLGTDVLGEQSLVAYVASSFSHVLVFSVTIASVQLLASATGSKDLHRAAWLSHWSSWVHLVTGALSAACMVLIGLSRDQFGTLWFLAAAIALVDAVGWAHAARNIAQNGWGPTSTRRLVGQALNPLLAIAALLVGLGIEAVFAVQLVVSLVLTVVLRRIDLRTNALPRREEPAPPWRPVLRLWGMFVLSGLIFQVVERRLELVFIDHYQDARAVAMYSVAFSLVAIPTTLLGSVIGAAMPAIAARSTTDPRTVELALGRAARILVTLELLAVAGAVAVGPRLVVVAYGPAFVEAASLVRLLAFILLLAPLGQLYATFWTGTGRLRPVLVAGGCAAVVDLALAWLLVPRFAGAGAVAATMAAQAVSATVLVVHTHRSGITLDVRPWRLLRAMAVALVAGLAAGLVTEALPGVLGVAVAVLVFAVVLAVGSRLVGLLEEGDVDWVAGTVPRRAAGLVVALSPRR